jgi:hypothetical protein
MGCRAISAGTGTAARLEPLAGAYFSFALKSIWMTVISVSTSTCCNSDLERGGRKRYAAAASSCTAFPKK